MTEHTNVQQDKQLDEKAAKIIAQFQEDENVTNLIDSLSGLGEEAQKNAGESLEALKRPVNEMLNDQNQQLPEQLHKLKEIVGELEPDYLKEGQLKKMFNRLLRKNPIEQYAKKYQTIESQVERVIEGLLSGRDKLQEDTLMLQQLKETASQRIKDLDEEIAIGKSLQSMLEAEMTSEKWKDNPVPLQKGQQKVVSRIKNMSQAIMVLQQSIASVDLIIENNDKLDEAIFNAMTMTKNVISVTASIQLALGNQKKVINAVQNVNQATESMLLSNAEMLKSNTEETLKTLEEPAIALESFQKAYNDVFDAIQLTEESNERIVSNGKKVIAELDQLNQQMKTKLIGR
ncbi:toxic anion resistance protein [Desertibacillus haloalkaliphilus]|uniref:toxic anion resistance protein n=1 Tax=Desertibacillus haloalkaliphilus TaxID=1328930 RepID=UPI001C265BB6|nr:toxic anion resistance protein [Desertibacillus haloalkaliphilus]MBU8907327.1 toxic anion resistance protein [Desertibacillus haloalkaliphilus]